MQDKSTVTQSETASDNEGKMNTKKMINPEDDGRNKEWQDRTRVNLEEVPEGTKTILERDFEPEQSDDEKSGNEGPDKTPAY